MPYYQLEWQTLVDLEGVKVTLNYAKGITINKNEENPDEVAQQKAQEIFDGLSEFSATLKKIVYLFQKKDF